MTELTSLPQFPWLSLLVVLPLAGALLCLMHSKRPADCRALSLATSLAVFGVALYLFICHGQGEGRWLLYEDAHYDFLQEHMMRLDATGEMPEYEEE